MISAARSAPKEVSDIARVISDLSIVLGELRRVLRDGKDNYRRKLMRRVQSATKRIGKIHDEIKELMPIGSGMSGLKWSFRRSKATALLYQIESHKTGNMILQTMSLAIELKLVSRLEGNLKINSKEAKEYKELIRQQAENPVEAAKHSLQEVISNKSGSSGDSTSDAEHEADVDGETPESKALVGKESKPNDTGRWLHDLVFSAAIDAHEARNTHLITPK